MSKIVQYRQRVPPLSENDLMIQGGDMNCIETGTVTFQDRDISADELPWQAHPSFRGISMKHLIRGESTDGRFSCHLVKADPGCALEEHAHEDRWELHNVLEGDGHCLMGDKSVLYQPGYMAVIPQGIKHRVEAGSGGLVLLAQFTPALL
jgi:mannose-6-phosphate isomerase-like protein (cupin superfamily)